MQVWQQLQLIEAYGKLERALAGGTGMDGRGRTELEREKDQIREVLGASNPVLVERYDRLRRDRKRPLAAISSRGHCTGCNLVVGSAFARRILRLEEIVYHDEVAVCGRIMLPGFQEGEGVPHRVSGTELASGEIALPLFALSLSSTKSEVCLLDVWNERWVLRFDGDRISGLDGVFTRYGVEQGDVLYFYLIDKEEATIRVLPSIVSVNDLDRVVQALRGRRGLSLDVLAREVLSHRVQTYDIFLVREKLRLALARDARFQEKYGKWLLAEERENSPVLPADLDRLYEFLKGAGKPVPNSELAAKFLQILQEEGYSASIISVYSPRRTYQVGEKVLFLEEGNSCLAEVLAVSPSGGKMHVQYRGTSKWDAYPIQSRAELTEESTRSRDERTSTASIVALTTALEMALGTDSRFCRFRDDWLAEELLVKLDAGELNLVFTTVVEALEAGEKIGVPSKILVERVFGLSAGAPKSGLYEFGLNNYLARDRRFLWKAGEEGILWTLKEPVAPRTSYYTLTEEAIAQGFIKLRPGMKEMLAKWTGKGPIELLTYGNYVIEALFDRASFCIQADGIREWFLENGLRPGDKVYIQAQEEEGQRLRLYTDHERARTTRAGNKRFRERLHLRHRVYGLLKDEGRFLHLREIVSRLEESVGKTIPLASVRVVLSRNPHLFYSAGRSRALWGLKVWEQMVGRRVDPASLVIAIAEEDLVCLTLQERGTPLSTRELAAAVAEAFVVKIDEVLETTFINPEDTRLTRLEDGRWALACWVGGWRGELAAVREKLAEASRLNHELRRAELRSSQVDGRLERLAETILEGKERIAWLELKAARVQAELDDISCRAEKEGTMLSVCRKKMERRRQAAVFGTLGGVLLWGLIPGRNVALLISIVVGLIWFLRSMLLGLRVLRREEAGIVSSRQTLEEAAKEKRGEIEAYGKELESLAPAVLGAEVESRALKETLAGIMAELGELRERVASFDIAYLTEHETELLHWLALAGYPYA